MAETAIWRAVSWGLLPLNFPYCSHKSPTFENRGVNLSARLVVLVSGSGTNLAALLDAAQDPAYGAAIVAVGADRDGIEGLARAQRAGIPTFVAKVGDFATRDDWDAALTEKVAEHEPTLVVSAGFMKILGKR